MSTLKQRWSVRRLILFHFQCRIKVVSTLIHNVKTTLIWRWNVGWDLYKNGEAISSFKMLCKLAKHSCTISTAQNMTEYGFSLTVIFLYKNCRFWPYTGVYQRKPLFWHILGSASLCNSQLSKCFTYHLLYIVIRKSLQFSLLIFNKSECIN